MGRGDWSTTIQGLIPLPCRFINSAGDLSRRVRTIAPGVRSLRFNDGEREEKDTPYESGQDSASQVAKGSGAVRSGA